MFGSVLFAAAILILDQSMRHQPISVPFHEISFGAAVASLLPAKQLIPAGSSRAASRAVGSFDGARLSVTLALFDSEVNTVVMDRSALDSYRHLLAT